MNRIPALKPQVKNQDDDDKQIKRGHFKIINNYNYKNKILGELNESKDTH